MDLVQLAVLLMLLLFAILGSGVWTIVLMPIVKRRIVVFFLRHRIQYAPPSE